MNATKLVLFAITLAVIFSITEVSIFQSIANAQTPTTSDLPVTIGNESTSDMGLTNNSMPVPNTTTVYAPPPV